MVKKITTIVFFMLLLGHTLYAQILKGNIRFYPNLPAYRANIIIRDSISSSSISEYHIVKNGEYKFALEKKYSSKILLEITAVGYVTTFFEINNPKEFETYTQNFVLQKDTIISLKEVTIKASKPAFFVAGDTVSYNVSAFRDGSERKIEDLIKKLPGVQINTKTGEIKYNGKSIETVKIEGDDLFGQNYMIGTKNINIDIVEQVQALENYSANSLLKGIENSDKVALNLKLKNDKMDFSGDINYGNGLNNNKKIVADITSNVLSISKKYKGFANFSYNNIGSNYTPYDYFNSGSSYEKENEKSFFAPKVIIDPSLGISIDDYRANINNSFFANYSSIVRPKKNISIKTNLYYITDKIASIKQTKNLYTFHNQSISTHDSLNIVKKPMLYRGDVEIQINTSKQSVLKSVLKISQEDVNSLSETFFNNNNSFVTSLESKSFWVKNTLSFTQRISEKNAWQLESSQSFNDAPQAFIVKPANIIKTVDAENENIQVSNFKNQYFDIKTTLFGINTNSKYSLSAGYYNRFLPFYSLLNTKPKEENNLKYTYKLLFVSYTNSVNMKGIKFTTSIFANHIFQNLVDVTNKINTTNTVISPDLNCKLKITNTSNLSLSAGYNKMPQAEDHLFRNVVLTDYRNLLSNEPSLELRKNSYSNLSYRINNLDNLFRLVMSVSYTNNGSNFFTQNIITPNIIESKSILLPAKNQQIRTVFLIEKFVPILSSTIRIETNYSLYEYKNMINDLSLRNNKRGYLNTELFIKTGFKYFINLENTLLVNRNQSYSEGVSYFGNTFLNNTFKIIIKPKRPLFALLSADTFLPDLNNKKMPIIFFDLMLKYTHKKTEIRFTAKNISNNSIFKQVDTSDFTQSITSVGLIQRYFMLSFNYNL
jgi:hypothetical protein